MDSTIILFHFSYSTIRLGDLILQRVPKAAWKELSESCKALWKECKAEFSMFQGGFAYRVYY
jgi:hypothetical protein